MAANAGLSETMSVIVSEIEVIIVPVANSITAKPRAVHPRAPRC